VDVLSADFDQTITKKEFEKCGFKYKNRELYFMTALKHSKT
jgi:hypothetical protein